MVYVSNVDLWSWSISIGFLTSRSIETFFIYLHAPDVFERNQFSLEEYCIKRGPLSHTISKIYTLLVALLIAILSEMGGGFGYNFHRGTGCKHNLLHI